MQSRGKYAWLIVWPDSYKIWPSFRGTNSRSLAKRLQSAADNAARRLFCCGRCFSVAASFFNADSTQTIVYMRDRLLKFEPNQPFHFTLKSLNAQCVIISVRNCQIGMFAGGYNTARQPICCPLIASD